MASTYSPLLRLELMATGEKNGQWGGITNTNLSTILEQAVAGTTSVSITGGGPITLTSNNGASDEAREAIVLVTGSHTGPVDIIAPATSKIYLVNNLSDQSVSLKKSGGTAATVEAGAKKIVFFDTSTSQFVVGPSVSSVQVSGGSTGLTFSGGPIVSSGTLTAGGTLAIASGGTGQTTASAAINALLPSQVSNTGKILTTDGTDPSWASSPAIQSSARTGFSGSSVTVGSLPTGIKKFTILVDNVTLSGTNNLLLSFANSDGYVGTYSGSVGGGTPSVFSAAGSASILNSAEAESWSGIITVALASLAVNNLWVISWNMATTSGASAYLRYGAGSFSLSTSNPITTVKFEPSAGTFSSGNFLVQYEV